MRWGAILLVLAALGPSTSVAQPSAPSAAERDAGIELYQYRLVQVVRKVRIYPEAARERDLTGTTTVEFTVLPQGTLGRRSIVQSSGHPVLDQAALEIIARAVPLTEIPAALQNSAFSLRVAIAFALPGE